MTKKYPKSKAIEDAELEKEEAYVTWGDDLASKQQALELSSKSLAEFDGIHKNGERGILLFPFFFIPNTRFQFNPCNLTTRKTEINDIQRNPYRL